MNRRGFLAGIIAACAAPAIIRTAGLIMPIKPLREPTDAELLALLKKRVAEAEERTLENIMRDVFSSGSQPDMAFASGNFLTQLKMHGGRPTLAVVDDETLYALDGERLEYSPFTEAEKSAIANAALEHYVGQWEPAQPYKPGDLVEYRNPSVGGIDRAKHAWWSNRSDPKNWNANGGQQFQWKELSAGVSLECPPSLPTTALAVSVSASLVLASKHKEIASAVTLLGSKELSRRNLLRLKAGKS